MMPQKVSWKLVWLYLQLILVLIVLVFVGTALGAMSKSKAITEAHKIWGNNSWVGNSIAWGQSTDTYQIGYTSPGCLNNPTIVGSARDSWDAAFAALPTNKGITGTYTGLHDLVSETPPPSDTSNEVNRASAPGMIVKVQFVIDGNNFMAPVDVVYAPVIGWTAKITWDTKTASNGNHYVCSLLIHPDGSWQTTPAGMVIVQNP